MLPLVVAACVDQQSPSADPPETFAREVQPILMNKCSGNTGGCHSAGTAYLDVTDYRTIVDTPSLNDPATTQLVFLPVPHAGGQGLLNALASQTIVNWLDTLHGEPAGN